MLGNQRRCAPVGVEPLRHRPVQLDAGSPGDVAVERVAPECVPECHPARRVFGDDASAKQLVRPRIEPSHGPDQLRVEDLAHHGRCDGRRAGIIGQVSRLEEHGIADVVG